VFSTTNPDPARPAALDSTGVAVLRPPPSLPGPATDILIGYPDGMNAATNAASAPGDIVGVGAVTPMRSCTLIRNGADGSDGSVPTVLGYHGYEQPQVGPDVTGDGLDEVVFVSDDVSVTSDEVATARGTDGVHLA
jgi:hypothetical protein